MKRYSAHLLVVVLVLATSTRAWSQEAHHHPPGDADRLGKVEFPISCSPESQQQFTRALASLHSFWYPQAEQGFTAVAEKEPGCAMAHWGVAMSLYHPLWAPASKADILKARAALEKAGTATNVTPRERDYLAAITAYYRDADRVDHPARVRAWSDGMEQVYRKYPEDNEAAIFYALSLLATAHPTDMTYARQKAATAILEKIWASHRDHPGVAHYLIHGYDSPAMAQHGLEAARAYARIAPASAHALHMPSHIFSRLGLWGESVQSNMASAVAARKYSAEGMRSYGDEIHALDFQLVAYMQMRDLEAAREVIDQLRAVPETERGRAPLAYAKVVVPARYLVEQRNWNDAASVGPVEGDSGVRATIHWIRGVGTARIGQLEQARQEAASLATLVEAEKSNPDTEYQDSFEVLRLNVSAWIAYAAGQQEDAVRLMRQAADLDDSIIYSRTRMIPSREHLADLLAELDRPADALREYEAALKTAPGRFNSLLGASRAAAKLGDREKSDAYLETLRKQAPKAERAGVSLR